MLFPLLCAHVSVAEFQYPDFIWREPTGIMPILVGDLGCNKGKLSTIVEAICHLFEPARAQSRVSHVHPPEAARRDEKD